MNSFEIIMYNSLYLHASKGVNRQSRQSINHRVIPFPTKAAMAASRWVIAVTAPIQIVFAGN